MKSDYQETGKLYPKLDAYMFYFDEEAYPALDYLGSSCQFKTQKKYYAWLKQQDEYKHLPIRIKRAE
jgi:hypothetical protein